MLSNQPASVEKFCALSGYLNWWMGCSWLLEPWGWISWKQWTATVSGACCSLCTLVLGARKGSFTTWCSMMEAIHKPVLKQGQKLVLQVKPKHLLAPHPLPRSTQKLLPPKAAGSTLSTILMTTVFFFVPFYILYETYLSQNKQKESRKIHKLGIEN